MEHMAADIEECLKHATFGGLPLQCKGGIPFERYLFNDQKHLQEFLSLTEERELGFSHSDYTVIPSKLLDEVGTTWDIDTNFTGNYCEDYRILNNTLILLIAKLLGQINILQ